MTETPESGRRGMLAFEANLATPTHKQWADKRAPS